MPFGKSDAMLVRSRDPCTAETPRDLLGASALTAAEVFDVSTHGAVPPPDASACRLDVGGLVGAPLTLDLATPGEDRGRWSWRLWSCSLGLVAGEHELVVRAGDSAAAARPEHPGPLWNPKGDVDGARGRVRVSVG